MVGFLDVVCVGAEFRNVSTGRDLTSSSPLT